MKQVDEKVSKHGFKLKRIVRMEKTFKIVLISFIAVGVFSFLVFFEWARNSLDNAEQIKSVKIERTGIDSSDFDITYPIDKTEPPPGYEIFKNQFGEYTFRIIENDYWGSKYRTKEKVLKIVWLMYGRENIEWTKVQ